MLTLNAIVRRELRFYISDYDAGRLSQMSNLSISSVDGMIFFLKIIYPDNPYKISEFFYLPNPNFKNYSPIQYMSQGGYPAVTEIFEWLYWAAEDVRNATTH